MLGFILFLVVLVRVRPPEVERPEVVPLVVFMVPLPLVVLIVPVVVPMVPLVVPIVPVVVPMVPHVIKAQWPAEP